MIFGGRNKCVVRKFPRVKTREIKFRGTEDHVTVMLVVSGSVHIYTLVLVLRRVIANYQKVQICCCETPADKLHTPNYFYMRKVTSFDSNIF